MKVLVIGGTLFIGKLLVEELLKEGHDIAVLHRKPKHDFGRRVENLMADRNDAEACAKSCPAAVSTWYSTMSTILNAAPRRPRSRPPYVPADTAFPATSSCRAWPPMATA